MHFRVAILMALLPACAPGAGPEPSAGAVPEPRVVDLAAVKARMQELRGQPVLLNFWATWCPPCVAELPELAEAAQEYEDRGLAVVTISYDYMVPGPADGAAAVALAGGYLRKHQLPLECLVYDEDDYDGINEWLKLPGPIPVTLAFDANGNEVGRVEDRTDLEGFRKLAEAALATAPRR